MNIDEILKSLTAENDRIINILLNADEMGEGSEIAEIRAFGYQDCLNDIAKAMYANNMTKIYE